MYNKENNGDWGKFKMSKKIFTEREIKILSDNPHVKSVSSKGITNTEDFKRIFIAENEKGEITKTNI